MDPILPLKVGFRVVAHPTNMFVISSCAQLQNNSPKIDLKCFYSLTSNRRNGFKTMSNCKL